MQKNLSKVREMFRRALEIKENIERDMELTNLMDFMEHTFRIPMLKSPEYEKENPEVIDLYRKISLARNFEESGC